MTAFFSGLRDMMTVKAKMNAADLDEEELIATQRHTRSKSASVEATTDTKNLNAELHSRIAYLEKKGVDLDSRNSYLEKKYASLESKHERLTAMYRTNLEELERKRKGEDRYERVIQRCFIPYTEARRRLQGVETPNYLEVYIESLLTDAVDALRLRPEVHRLQQDLQSLQDQLLKRADTVPILVDDELKRMFGPLVSAVRTLSRTVKEPSKMTAENYKSMGVALRLLKDIPSHHWMMTTRKRSLIEAAIWSVLLDVVFAHPFQIFGKRYNHLHGVWQHLFSANEDNELPTPTQMCELWRYKTVEHLVEVGGKDTITQGLASFAMTKATSSIIEHRNNVEETILHRLANLCSNVDLSHVRAIIDKSFELAMHMALQRPRIGVAHPNVRDIFSGKDMTSQADSESDDDDAKGMHSKVVGVVINPGLSKWGDAHGDNYSHRYDIVIPRVIVDTIAPKRMSRQKNVPLVAIPDLLLSRKEGQGRLDPHAVRVKPDPDVAEHARFGLNQELDDSMDIEL